MTIALWTLLGIVVYIIGWFVTARLGYYTADDNRGDTHEAFFFCSFMWFFLIFVFLPWAIGKKINEKFTIRRPNAIPFVLPDFVCKGPKAHFRSKAGL